MDLVQTVLVLAAPEEVSASIYLNGVAREIPPGTYVLQAGNFQVVADPKKKGKPGDIVVVWPRKKGPIISRRLSQYERDSNYYFRSLENGQLFALLHDKVSAIHAVIGL